MLHIDFVSYLKTLKPKDWEKMATAKWTVKDVVAHMVGWEKGDVEAIRKAWETKQPPWWKGVNNYDDFNQKWVEYYRKWKPDALIAEWKKYQKAVQTEIDRIGKENLRAFPELFVWLFEEGDYSHYKHHLKQIQKAIKEK